LARPCSGKRGWKKRTNSKCKSSLARSSGWAQRTRNCFRARWSRCNGKKNSKKRKSCSRVNLTRFNGKTLRKKRNGTGGEEAVQIRRGKVVQGGGR
jgi:hypothetical protein